MSRNSKNRKKSTSKYRKFKVSPLIPVIAVIEVLVLIVASTYAWFTFAANKTIDTGTISVDADSGLDIDFQYSNIDDYINIWNYVDKDFTFEPVTSLDGRNVFVPTSGTFNSQNTGTMVFRDGTINDINSKYLNIDFELTNTSDYKMFVYLNNKSYFRVKDNTGNMEESRALRLAFYPNNGASGNVGSSLISASSGSSDGADTTGTVDSSSCTIYFDNSSTNWSQVYAYLYDSTNPAVSPEYYTAWPGEQMTRTAGKVYSLTIPNPLQSTNDLTYDKVIFTNNSGSQTGKKNVKNGYVYSNSSAGSEYKKDTLYFLKPYEWGDKVYCHTFQGGSAYTTYPGDAMTYVGSGIYAYSYNSAQTGKFLFDDGGQGTSNGVTHQTVDITMPSGGANDKIYYVTTKSGSGSNMKYNAEMFSTAYSALTYKTVYFFNTFGWEKPYATATVGSGSTANTVDIPMTSLSGNVYYCTIPSLMTHVYFRAKEQNDNSYRSVQTAATDGNVYRPNEEFDGSGYRKLTEFVYDTFIQADGYPVISPGVSVGFQRPYSPVVSIDSDTGSAKEIIPAFSNSIDNYILGSGTPVFTIEPGHMLSLSMVMWLEGTDSATNDATYPGNNIELCLEFSTEYFPNGEDEEPVIVNKGDSDSYIYDFYDKTREVWTSNRQGTESGVTVAPVMQLYDNTIKRGYLMHPKTYKTYEGESKVSCWTVEAPQSIAIYGHDIIFRRVNPYDEDEVWNYWHAGPVAGSGTRTDADPDHKTALTPYDIAFSGGTTISFSAFADGSPLASMPGVGAAANVPAVSCGGLWGNHSVRSVTLYDGIEGQPLKHNDGIITVNYSYPYTANGTTQRTANIEYKASGPDNGSIYNIIMPTSAYARQTPCTFKNYINFDSTYAINSDRNANITFQRTYGEGQTVKGDFFELNRKSNGDDISYWGSDILYIQSTSVTKNELLTNSDSKLLQVRFLKTNTAEDRSASFYSYLYENSNFGPQGEGRGFAAVIPNDAEYAGFVVESCNHDGTQQYNITPMQSIQHASAVRIKDQLNASTYVDMKVNHMNGKNGLNLSYIYAYIYLQTNQKSYGNDPKAYIYKDNGGEYTAWPGAAMEVVNGNAGNNQSIYRFKADLSRYDRLIFSFYGGDGNNKSQTLWLNGYDSGRLMKAIGTYTVTQDGYYSGVTKNEMIEVEYWPDGVGSWPHLTLNTGS